VPDEGPPGETCDRVKVPRHRLAAASFAVLTVAACTSGAGTQGRSTGSATPRPTSPGPTSSARIQSATTAPQSPTPTRTPTRTPTIRPTATSSPTLALQMPQVAAGLTVVLNPGHNGGNAAHPAEINRQVPAGYGGYKACDTTGTNTDAGYPEHAFNWDVALRVRAILRAHGVHVVMTRPDDSGVGPCVDERAAIGNEAGVAAVVSIHADGAPASGHGFHVNQDSRRPDGATAATARRSIELGRALHAALESSSGLVPSTYIGTDGYFYRSDLAGLNLATNPATFLELGNMRNSGDAVLQTSAAGRQRIASAIALGILVFLKR
jgi:N-acetylmuramoyl-L-alanine amidase